MDSRTTPSPFIPSQIQVGSPVTGTLTFGSKFALFGDGIPNDPTRGFYSVKFDLFQGYGLFLSALFAAVRPAQLYSPIAPWISVEHGPNGDYVTFGGEADNGFSLMTLTFSDPTGRSLTNDAFTFDMFRATTWQSVALDLRSLSSPGDPTYWNIHALVSVPEGNVGFLGSATLIAICVLGVRFRRARA